MVLGKFLGSEASDSWYLEAFGRVYIRGFGDCHSAFLGLQGNDLIVYVPVVRNRSYG